MAKWAVLGSILALIVLGVIFATLISTEPEPPKNLDDFAQCLTDAGATFYGASWCGHCKEQKQSFGDSLQYVNYVECAEGTGQTEECIEAGIHAYPTWRFADGSEAMGFQDHKTLAEKTGCEL
ncbi:hypothetical protein KY329_05415 [Candidatus Woesearchaeota archaeon]|nr:hypothetical protein [Candidatus Woesearchaeota archaeon]